VALVSGTRDVAEDGTKCAPSERHVDVAERPVFAPYCAPIEPGRLSLSQPMSAAHLLQRYCRCGDGRRSAKVHLNCAAAWIEIRTPSRRPRRRIALRTTWTFEIGLIEALVYREWAVHHFV